MLAAPAWSAATNTTDPDSARITEFSGKQPLSFEANQGQADERIDFISRSTRGSVFLAPTEATFVIQGADAKKKGREFGIELSPTSDVLRLKLVGAQVKAKAVASDPLPGKANYFVGSDPKKWHTNIPTYKKVRYQSVYDGIDLVYYGNERQLEFDFVVAPEADPAVIALQFDGAEKLEVDVHGDLKATTRTGLQVVQHKPLVYQKMNGERREVRGEYALQGQNRVRFQIAAYDHTQPLIIDPTLSYATYLGGSDSDAGTAIAADAAGNVYVAGYTRSPDFPVTQAGLPPIDPSANYAAFVTKFSPTGAVIYSTYLGSYSGAYGVAVDDLGSVYLTGNTRSHPTTPGAFRTTPAGDLDAFISKLDASGSQLIYSTYLGGSAFDTGMGIAIDNNRNACVLGLTVSTDLPVLNAFQPGYAGGRNDAGFGDYFVSKVNSAGSALIFSTYLGGSGAEGMGVAATSYLGGIASDSNGNVYVVGTTASSDFPTHGNAFQPYRQKNSDCAGCPSAFVTKFNPSGSLLYSTYLGGSEDDYGTAVAVDGAGHAHVTGRVGSCDFPFHQQAVDPASSHEGAFVCKFNDDGSGLLYSTFIAGGVGLGIALDSVGWAYVTGQIGPGNRLTPVCAVQPAHAPTVSGGGPYSSFDAFVTKLAPDGASFGYATYLGGSDYDAGGAIAVDPAGNTYVAGVTSSGDFPTAHSAQANFGGGADAFVVKIAASSDCGPGPAFGPFTSWPPCSTTPPTMTCPANIVVNATCGVTALVVNFPTPTVADACAGVTVTCNPPSGSAFPIGTTTVNCQATDACNKQASCSFSVTVNPAPLQFTGFLSPVGGADATGGSFASPLRTFKLNSTIPVKFTATCAGSPVLTGVHRLQVIKYSNQTTAGTPIDATPTDAATTGDQFRLTDSQWQFNLDTKGTGMSAGIWLLQATLSDGSQHSAWIQIK